MTYSASNCAGTGYSLGRLELTGSDPLSASSWTKYSSPIFTSANGCVPILHSFLEVFARERILNTSSSTVTMSERATLSPPSRATGID